jgi:FkbM family methyltransferase
MSIRIIGRSVWRNPGNRSERIRRLFAAAQWQFYKRIIKRPKIITLANGTRFWAYPDCVVSSALHYADWPEYEELQFCRKHLRRGDVVVDVGANVGHFSLLLADIVGPDSLFCFEPTPVTWRRLKNNFELNGWSTSRLYPMAVGQREGAVEFPDSESPETTNSLAWSKQGVSKTKVRLLSLDSLLPDFANREVGVLKIDVEGYEREVFLGARRFLREVRPRLVMFESLEQRLDEVLREVLSATLYTAFKLGPGNQPFEQPLDAQNLFAVPVEHRSRY